jgi:type IV secretion system protein VirD4
MGWFRSKEPDVIGPDAPDAVAVGRCRDEKTGRIGAKNKFAGAEPIVVIGRNRSGKDAGIGNYNGLQLEGKSWFVLDPRGEASAICGPYRRTLGPVYNFNPFGVPTTPGYADLQSDGFNPLAALDHNSPRFFDDVAGIAEALIKIESKDPHWSMSARGLVCGLTMWEVIDAAVNGRVPLLANVRAMLSEPDERDAKGKLVKGLAVTAARLAQQGGPQIASLLGRFTADNDEVQGVRATADGQTQWLLSQPMRDDMAKASIDLRQLGDRPVSVFAILPAEMYETHSVWLRLLVSSALRALYRPRPAGVVCTFWLNEFASLGRLAPVENALGLVAGYGIQLIIVVQSLTQLKLHYEDGWENFLGQAGCVCLIGPPGDAFTADYLSKRSGEKTIISPNAGLSLNPGGAGMSSGEGFTRRQWLSAADLYALQPGYGYVWPTGLAEGNAIPAYYPPYWDVELLAQRARANPYYHG